MSESQQKENEKETGRIEAFSDGVFAIAITLLVLELKVPRIENDTRLARELLALWPAYVAFVVSFATIGIMWLNHHQLFRMIVRVDHGLLVTNGMLLLGVTFVPFPTGVLAEHLRDAAARTATLFYSGTFVAIAVAYQLLWHHIARRRPALLRQDLPRVAIAATNRSYLIGIALYVAAFALAFASPKASVALDLALALFFALPRPLMSDGERPRRPAG